MCSVANSLSHSNHTVRNSMPTLVLAVRRFVSLMAAGLISEGRPETQRRWVPAPPAREQAPGAGGCTVRHRLHTGAAWPRRPPSPPPAPLAAVPDRLDLGSAAAAATGGMDAAPRPGQEQPD